MKVLELIGQGGFGNVERVQDKNGSIFARKTFSKNQPLDAAMLENVLKRFSKEVRIQSTISHRNIVPIISSDLNAKPPFYLMPLAESDLDKDIKTSRTLSGHFLSAISDIVAGLEELHTMQIYHRDLKPQNVLRFSESDGRSYYAISDFGLISQKESRLSKLTVTGMAKGSDYYTAPEIAQDFKKASPQSDIYSLGCILHDMIGISTRVPCNEINEGGAFGQILRGCTRLDPSKRFKSVKSVLDALLSVEFKPAVAPTQRSLDFIAVLDASSLVDEQTWKEMADYLEVETLRDRSGIFGKISAQRIEELCASYPNEGARLGSLYGEWLENTLFSFESCDAFGNRAEIFFGLGDFDTKVSILFALLNLGTKHNRWYVERKFARLCGSNMDDNLAKRFAMEIRIRGEEICDLVSHLERSISFDRTEFHPRILAALNTTCQ